MNDATALIESRQRIAALNRRASLRVALGPAPEPVRLPHFARRVRPLDGTVEVRRLRIVAAGDPAGDAPRAA